jgi:hypothetical protein
MTQSAIPAGDRCDEHDGMRQCEVQRAGYDHRWPAPGLF